ncbi:MAG: adenine methylase [Herminiimonas sp.]|nr:adenine methylase [Herminiimonas sp.]
MKPFLRWAGSKAQLVPVLREYWRPNYLRYVEPFCGSACLFFALEPPSALLSDLNQDLVDTLAQVQSAADTVAECLGRLKSDDRTYYKVRSLDPKVLSPNERAAQFIYLNTHCFNGLYRTNRQGKFNVPYGTKTRKLPLSGSDLREAARILKNAVLESGDFEPIVDQTIEGDFLYLDPPYATQSTRIFSQYGKKLFSDTDLARLTKGLRAADRRGVRFVLSYADVPEIRGLREIWTSKKVTVKRNIAGFTDARKTVQEIVVTNCE